jgi:hypothetical protein
MEHAELVNVKDFHVVENQMATGDIILIVVEYLEGACIHRREFGSTRFLNMEED